MKTAVIIGAGPAGLTCAKQFLNETDIKPIVLEATDDIGGISKTALHNGNRIDIGGHRFFSKDQRVMDFWLDTMPLQGAPAYDEIVLNTQKDYAEGGPDPEKDDRVMLLRRRVSRIYYDGKFFDYPISMKPKTFANMGFSRTLKAGFGYIGSCIHKRKEDSLEDFYINRFGKPLYEMFFEDYTNKVWGVHPSDIEPDWGAQRVKGLSLSKAVMSFLLKPFKRDNKSVETSLIEEFYYPKKGPGQLWEAVASDIVEQGGTIMKNTPVCSVNTDGNKIVSVTVDCNGVKKEICGDYFISSMPIKDLIAFLNCDKSDEICEISSDLPYRDFITVGLLVDKLAIKNLTKIKTLSDIVPDCWIYIQDRGVRVGRVQIFNNWSPYMVKDVENSVWIGLEYFCNENDDMWNMSDEDFIDFAIDEIVKIKIVGSRDDVRDSVRIKIKKAYPAYFGSYKKIDKLKSFLDSFDNLYCIGRNGQHRYNNMDHSMLTAIECVNCIKNGTDRSILWNVNAEQDYHEEK